MGGNVFLEICLMFPGEHGRMGWGFSRDWLLFTGNALWSQLLLPDCSVCMGTEKTENLNLLLLFWPPRLAIHTHPHTPQSAFYSWLTHLTKDEVTPITLNPSCGYGCWHNSEKCKNAKPGDSRKHLLVTCKYQICFLETTSNPERAHPGFPNFSATVEQRDGDVQSSCGQVPPGQWLQPWDWQ